MQGIWYEIRIQGTLGPDWAEWFDGMELRREGEKSTVLAGRIVDQAALRGILARVLDLNLTLLSVNPAPPPVVPKADDEGQGA